MIYEGWTCRWSGLVLVGEHQDGRRVSLGEVLERGRRRPICELVDPVRGSLYWRREAEDVDHARDQLEAGVIAAGGVVVQARRPSAAERVTEAVAAEPGLTTSDLARRIGVTPTRISQIARALGLRRELERDRTAAGGRGVTVARWFPVDGLERPVLPSPGGEPAAAGAQDAAGSPSSAGDEHGATGTESLTSAPVAVAPGEHAAGPAQPSPSPEVAGTASEAPAAQPSGPHAPVGSPEPPPPTPGHGSAVVPDEALLDGLRSEVARVGGSEAAAPLRAVALDGLLEQREVSRLRWDLGEAEGMLLLVDRLILVYAAHLRGEGRRVQVAYVAGVLGALAAGRDLR